MSGIGPISAVTPGITGSSTIAPASKAGDLKVDFGETLKACMDRVNTDQQASSTSISDLLSGKTEDVMPVISSVAKADMSFKLLIGVRNKVIEAYKQTMNMQI